MQRTQHRQAAMLRVRITNNSSEMRRRTRGAGIERRSWTRDKMKFDTTYKRSGIGWQRKRERTR